MNATQNARLMFMSAQSFLRGELNVDEFTALIATLDNMAVTAGIKDESDRAYHLLCRRIRNETEESEARVSLVRDDTMSLPTKEEGMQKFSVGDRVELHFFGSDRGEFGWVTEVDEEGTPLEFQDRGTTRIKHTEVVCYFAR